MYWLGKASHFNNLKHVIFGPIGDQKLGNTRNSYKVKSGVSQIHLLQLFHFINVRCNYCLQLSLSYPKFLQTCLNRRFFVLENRLQWGVLYKIVSKRDFFSKIDSKWEFFFQNLRSLFFNE